jgi:hypothetical protein
MKTIGEILLVVAMFTMGLAVASPHQPSPGPLIVGVTVAPPDPIYGVPELSYAPEECNEGGWGWDWDGGLGDLFWWLRK